MRPQARPVHHRIFFARHGLLLAGFVFAMCTVVALSNYLVQFPFRLRLGGWDLADLLTWGAFTYPAAFLFSDLANRRLGPAAARKIALTGFALAVILSYYVAAPRIAVASGSAFLVAQLLDISIFDRLRRTAWWKAPLVSTLIGSAADTLIFFGLAFSAMFAVLGPGDGFGVAPAPLLGLFPLEAPRWISWALGDFVVKLMVGAALLAPYRLLAGALDRGGPAVEPA